MALIVSYSSKVSHPPARKVNLIGLVIGCPLFNKFSWCRKSRNIWQDTWSELWSDQAGAV